MIVQIPSLFEYTAINFYIIHLKNDKPKSFLTGIFKGDVCKKYKKMNAYERGLGRVGELTEEFNDFIKNIDNYFFGKIINRDDLNVSDYEEFNSDNLNPIYYSKQAIKIRKELEESDYELLGDLAEIITTPTHKDIKAHCLYSTNFTYPLKLDDIKEKEIKRGIKLKKNDIIGLLIGEKNKFYLYINDYDNVFVNAGSYCLIRVKDKSMNSYLVNYLNDEKAMLYFRSMRKGTYIPHINKSYFVSLKVIKLTTDMINLSNESINYMIDTSKLSPYEINQIKRKNHQAFFEKESQKKLGDDIVKAISNLKCKVLKDLISDDLNEVEICYQNCAYKSAIILCESILEAVLLDWLSEYEKTDDILNVALNEDGRDLELNKIIFKLKDLIKPYWYEVGKAHEIRKTRNMVRPKECIKNNKKVNIEECKKIIDDLNDIIESKENKYE